MKGIGFGLLAVALLTVGVILGRHSTPVSIPGGTTPPPIPAQTSQLPPGDPPPQAPTAPLPPSPGEAPPVDTGAPPPPRPAPSHSATVSDWGSFGDYFAVSDVSVGTAKFTNPPTGVVTTIPVLKFLVRANHRMFTTPIYHAQFLDANGVTIATNLVCFGARIDFVPPLIYISEGQQFWGWVWLPNDSYQSIRIAEGGA